MSQSVFSDFFASLKLTISTQTPTANKIKTTHFSFWFLLNLKIRKAKMGSNGEQIDI